jgi:hypothetical protein
MHLLTGVIIAALAGRAKQNKVLQGLPRLQTGPIQVAHALPGRIRFIIPALRDRPEDMQDGIDQLATISGIDAITHSSVTGSLVVEFDHERIPPPLLFSAISRLLGLDHELDKPLTPRVIKELKQLGSSLNRMVYDETHGLLDLRTIAVGSLLVLGGRKLFLEKWGSFPTGLTLLWWAFHLINRGEGEID